MPEKPQEPTDSAGPALMPGKFVEALNGALAAAELEDQDQALVELALAYAHVLDVNSVGTLVKSPVGRDFLKVLTAMGLTPEARKAVSKGVTPHATVTSLTALRTARG
jgi:hypothetical protein